MWYIFGYGWILVKPYPFPYPSITSHIRDRIRQVSDRIHFCLPLAFGRSVGNNLFRFHPYLRSILSPAQKCESPGFHKTCDKAFEPTYFRLRSVCQTLSSVNNRKSHFPRRAVFLTSRSWIPSPPWSFGRQTILHLASLYFCFYYRPAKRILNGRNPTFSRLLLGEGRKITYTVPCLTGLNLWEPIFLLWTIVYPSNYLNAIVTFPQQFSIQHLLISENESKSPNI
jgi:hypothetical protein